MANNKHDGSFYEATLPPQKPVGATIGLVIVLLVLIAGGIFFWKEKVRRDRAAEQQIQMQNAEDGTTTDALSTNDDISSIEADLGGEADFGTMDADLKALGN